MNQSESESLLTLYFFFSFLEENANYAGTGLLRLCLAQKEAGPPVMRNEMGRNGRV
jgi:hypothetical protein